VPGIIPANTVFTAARAAGTAPTAATFQPPIDVIPAVSVNNNPHTVSTYVNVTRSIESTNQRLETIAMLLYVFIQLLYDPIHFVMQVK
jgi:hypothetical protein